MQAGDLLREVGLAREVAAPARRHDRQALAGHLDVAARAPEQRRLRLGVEVERQEPSDAWSRGVDRRGREPCAGGPPLRCRRGHGRIGRDRHQVCGARDGECSTLRVDAALEARARLADEAEAPRGPADRRRVPDGALEQDAARPGMHLGALATHDTGERRRSLTVVDDEVAGDERPVGAVERAQHLASGRIAHAEHPAGHTVEVERVQRLAELEHHVVRDVDDTVDRAHAALREARPQPQRRAAHDRTLERPGDERSDAVGVEHHARARGGGRSSDLRQWQQRRVEQRGEVAGDAADRELVAAVGLHRDLDDRLADRHELVERSAERNVVAQHEQSRVVVAEAELARRGEHAVGDLTADRARLELHAGDPRTDRRVEHDVTDVEVRCAAHDADLTGAVGSGHVDEAEAVRIGVRLVVQDACGAHTLDAGARTRHALDLEAGRVEPVDEVVERQLDVDHRGEPGQGDAHQKAARKRASAS